MSIWIQSIFLVFCLQLLVVSSIATNRAEFLRVAAITFPLPIGILLAFSPLPVPPIAQFLVFMATLFYGGYLLLSASGSSL